MVVMEMKVKKFWCSTLHPYFCFSLLLPLSILSIIIFACGDHNQKPKRRRDAGVFGGGFGGGGYGGGDGGDAGGAGCGNGAACGGGGGGGGGGGCGDGGGGGF